MPALNLQQLSDAVEELQGQAQKANENAVNFLLTQVQPLADKVTALAERVTSLEAALKAIEGTPAKP